MLTRPHYGAVVRRDVTRPFRRGALVRKTLTVLIASTGLLLGLGVAVPVSASAQGYAFNPYVIPANAQYICDGASQGSCASLPAGGAIFNGANLFAIGMGGAWRWDVVNIGTVNGNFTDGYIKNALRARTSYKSHCSTRRKDPNGWRTPPAVPPSRHAILIP